MTPTQKKCLNFIRTHQVLHDGVSPSIREIGKGINIKSAGAVVQLLDRMQFSGLITRTSKPRSIEITAINDNPDPWVKIGTAAMVLLQSIKEEHLLNGDKGNGEGTVTVDAAAIGKLDIALAEALEVHHG